VRKGIGGGGERGGKVPMRGLCQWEKGCGPEVFPRITGLSLLFTYRCSDAGSTRKGGKAIISCDNVESSSVRLDGEPLGVGGVLKCSFPGGGRGRRSREGFLDPWRLWHDRVQGVDSVWSIHDQGFGCSYDRGCTFVKQAG